MNKRRSRSVQATLAGIERLETERRKRGLTLEALARSANVAPDTLKRLSRRERVDRSSVRDIVSVLELEPTDIVDDHEWNQWYDKAEASGLETSGLATSGLATPGLETPGLVTPGLVTSGLATPGLATPGLTTPGLATPGLPRFDLNPNLDSNSELNSGGVAVKIAPAINSAVSSDITQPDLAQPDFSLYIERPDIEDLCQQTIETNGGLLRIKAPQHMGKTALLTSLLWNATQQGYQTVCLSFQLADSAVFSDLNTFLKWFCAVVSRELSPDKIPDDALEAAWKEIYSGNYNATAYFQDHLLNALDQPLVLALDNTDLVFEHEGIATDFCKLLRNWHDLPRRSDRNSAIWQKLRLVIVHATEIYGTLDINTSPLAGVGVLVDLPELTFEQVQDLVKRYGLMWSPAEVARLTHLVGGHPYLLQLGLEQMQRQSVGLDQFLVLDQFLEVAATEAGIYSNHLRQQLSHLEQSPELTALFRAVVRAEDPVSVKPAQAFKLQSMGLVHLEGNLIKPRCLLYRQYFLNSLQ